MKSDNIYVYNKPYKPLKISRYDNHREPERIFTARQPSCGNTLTRKNITIKKGTKWTIQ